MADPFDSLAWNISLQRWLGSAQLTPSHPIDLHLKELEVAVARARPKWDRLRAAEPAERAEVAGQMTAAHNDYCDPEDEVTEAQFAERLTLRSVLFESGGMVELTYADGGLLGGH